MIEFAPWVESVWQDVRYAVRGLRRQPAFTLAAIFTLGVGIGLNTSVATIFTSMFWRQWRVANPEQVVQVMIRDSRRASTEVRYPRYWALADSARLTEVVASSCGSGPRASDCRDDGRRESGWGVRQRQLL